ncbi:MAG: rhodanese-like domain-containing protein [Pyrinomonadaceae bacterium]
MRLIVPFFAIVVLTLGVLTACNSAELKNGKTLPVVTVGSPPPPGPATDDGVRRVTVAELKDLLAKNGAVVIDVRNQASYDLGHVKGAKLIPEGEVAGRSDELPRNKLIVTYCS